jgi:ABC-type Fe3+-hydroxamate transport system substrate-binding protein
MQNSEKKIFIDQLGESVLVSFPPTRIVSLVPSQTELLADLELSVEVVGITKFCVHPHGWTRSKKIIGGTKNFQFDTIDELKPDLIIGNKEENYKEGIEALKKKHPVWMSDIVSFKDALAMITSLGQLTNRNNVAGTITNQIQTSFLNLRKSAPKTVLYLIWKKPWMAAGTENFIHAMLEKIGLKNCLKDSPRYPALTDEDIHQLKADFIFLSSEPYPFNENHIQDLKRISPSSVVTLVDGEMFSWYGSRLTKAPAYFNSLKLQQPEC